MQLNDNSPDYYRMREAQERAMAAKAQDEDIRQIHQAMADKYRDMAECADVGRNGVGE
jgi:hypothetical protein